MSNSNIEAPDSPFVTYPPDAARPGHNFKEFYRQRDAVRETDSADEEDYVPIQGDEDFTEMTGPWIPASDISHLATSNSTSTSFHLPNLPNATLPLRFGASLSSTSVASCNSASWRVLLESGVPHPHPNFW